MPLSENSHNFSNTTIMSNLIKFGPIIPEPEREKGLILEVGDEVKIAHGAENADMLTKLFAEMDESLYFPDESDDTVGVLGHVKEIRLLGLRGETTDKLYSTTPINNLGHLTITIKPRNPKLDEIKVTLDSLVNYSVIPEIEADMLYDETCDKTLRLFDAIENIHDILTETDDSDEYPEHLLNSAEYKTLYDVLCRQVVYNFNHLLVCRIKKNKEERMKICYIMPIKSITMNNF